MKHVVTFQKSGRGPAQCPPDLRYPKGKVVNAIDVATNGQKEIKACSIALPYPAPECGMHLVRCTEFWQLRQQVVWMILLA
jgi:hypothetical protein